MHGGGSIGARLAPLLLVLVGREEVHVGHAAHHERLVVVVVQARLVVVARVDELVGGVWLAGEKLGRWLARRLV